MKQRNQQQAIAAPVMQVADQLTEQDVVLQIKDGIVGFIRHRLVDELHHQTGSEKNSHQYDRHPPESPGQVKGQGSFRNRSGSEMQDKAVEKIPVGLAIDRLLIGSGKD